MDPGDGTHNNHSTQQDLPLTSSHSVKDVIVLKQTALISVQSVKEHCKFQQQN